MDRLLPPGCDRTASCVSHQRSGCPRRASSNSAAETDGIVVWMNVQNAFFFRRSYIGAVSVGLLVGSSMNYLQSFLERVLIQPRNMMLWFILLAATARITAWRKAEMRRRRQMFLDQFKLPEPKRRLLEYHEPIAA